MPVLPSSSAPIIGTQPDSNGRLPGLVTPAWMRFFTALAQGPQAAQPQTPSASPYAFTAPEDGSLVVSGGTVSRIMLTRGRATLNLGAVSGRFPASAGDMFTITYSAAPIVTFLPG